MLSKQIVTKLAESAHDKSRIAGLTHHFYRYPARFSPIFASTAIELLSKPGDIILDPYMGGGTTIIEAIVAGRRAIGSDLNSLAAFLVNVKTTILTAFEKKVLCRWADDIIPCLTYHYPRKDIEHLLSDSKTKNLSLYRARFIKKIIAAAINSLTTLGTENAANFVRCAILNTSQWALDGRKRHTTLNEFRDKLKDNIYEMLKELGEFEQRITSGKSIFIKPTLIHTDAALIDKESIFSEHNPKADLIVTSPPYPGLHILYHRWQVDGRRETPAPYWIAGCEDGQGDSFYNFGSRHQPGLDTYFEKSLNTLKAIRKVTRDRGYIVQMLSFSNPEEHLPRYLDNMKEAGFKEVKLPVKDPSESESRIWRTVPNRKWHANLHRKSSGSREVVLIHKAN